VSKNTTAAPLARQALRDHRAQLRITKIAWLHRRHTGSHGFNGARRSMAHRNGQLVVECRRPGSQVRMADAAGDDVDDDLAGPGWDDGRPHLDRLTLLREITPRNV